MRSGPRSRHDQYDRILRSSSMRIGRRRRITSALSGPTSRGCWSIPTTRFRGQASDGFTFCTQDRHRRVGVHWGRLRRGRPPIAEDARTENELLGGGLRGTFEHGGVKAPGQGRWGPPASSSALSTPMASSASSGCDWVGSQATAGVFSSFRCGGTLPQGGIVAGRRCRQRRRSPPGWSS